MKVALLTPPETVSLGNRTHRSDFVFVSVCVCVCDVCRCLCVEVQVPVPQRMCGSQSTA